MTGSRGNAISQELEFDYDAQAAQSAASYLSSKCDSPVATEKLCNLLFLADRKHLIRFGRPITGDVYEATPTGAVPVKTVQVLSTVSSNLPYDPALLSESDFLMLDQVSCEYGTRNNQQVGAAVQSLEAYQRAWSRRDILGRQSVPMYFEDFFADAPESLGVLRRIAERQWLRRSFPDPAKI